MHTRFLAAGRAAWHFLTAIPGWPDATPLARTLYALPLALPLASLLVLATWIQLIRDPQRHALRGAHQPAVQLEAEIDALRLESSDAQAAESATATERLLRTLIQGPNDLAAQMDAMRAAAGSCGWLATLHPNDPGDGSSDTAAPLLYRTVRGRLAPTTDNSNDFASLLVLLDRLVPADKRGGLTRLSVRADEHARLSVECGVRFATLPTHEKTP